MLKQKGLAPILLPILAAAGIIIYLLISSTFPFKDRLFSLLYPKPTSEAQGINLTISGINASNNMATLEGFNFTWEAGSIGLTDGAYAVLFVTTRDEIGNIVDQHWLVGSQATEGLFFSGSYTFPVAGTAVITVWETNKVDCAGFSCSPSLAIHDSGAFSVPGISPTPSPTPTLTPTPSPTISPSPSPTAPPTQNYGSITGTVYSSTGVIIEGAKVSLTAVTGGRKKLASTTSNSLGVYTLSNLTPDNYLLSVSAKGHLTVTSSITVSSGNTLIQNITLIKR